LQAQVTVQWANFPGGVSVAVDAANNIYSASWDYNPAGDITLTKWNTAGSVVWTASYNNTDNTRHEAATWLDTDSQGNILVSGTIRSGYSNPVNANSLLMKFSPSGSLIWRQVYGTNFDGSSTVRCLVDAQDNIYVLGIGNSGAGLVSSVRKFNSAGTTVWTWFDNAGIGAPQNFKLTPDNKLLIIGRGITGSMNSFAKIDLNGTKLWGIGPINSTSAGDAAGDALGNTYLVNGTYGITPAGSIVRKVSSTGTLIWEKTNTITGTKIEVGNDSRPVLSGYPSVGYGAAFLKLDESGNLLWQNNDADGPSYNLLSHAQLRLDGSNAAYLAASIMTQMAVCKVNANGTSAWTATMSTGYAYALDFGTGNEVFVGGGTTAMLVQSGTISTPAVPTALTATATGSSTINITWKDNSTNETAFALQRSTSATAGFTSIASLAANTVSYANTGLAAGTTYYYRILASNGAGASAWSSVASATTQAAATVPATPSALVATPKGCLTMNLTWSDNSNNETGFTVARSTSVSGTYSTIATLPANTVTYTNTGLIKGRRYYYQVKATNATGSSAWSPKANAIASCLKSGSIGDAVEPVTIPYPNPVTDGWFTLNLDSGYSFPVTIQIFSVTGQKVLDRQLEETTNTIDTRGIPQGLYILTVKSLKQTASYRLHINN
jgi:hypothetical protein